MNSYTQYIQIDENSNVINAFTSAQEENYKDATKIEIGKGLRQFNLNTFPKGFRDMETGKANYKWNSAKKKIEEIPVDTVAIAAKKKEIELLELRRKAKEEILDRFLSEEKSFLEIAEEVRMEMRKKEKEVN
jgi:hypothetical protein